MHKQARAWVQQQVAEHGPFRNVVEIGSRDINGGIRDLFAGASYTGVDIAPGLGVDVVADGATYEPSIAPDCVVCCEVLEHTLSAAAIVANCERMLAKGGTLIITCATTGRDPHSAIDLKPIRKSEWYRNVTEYELRDWLDEGGFAFISTVTPPGYTDLYAVAVK